MRVSTNGSRFGSPPARIWLLNAVQAAVAASIVLVFLRHDAPYDSAHHLWWVVLAPMFYLTERFVVHVRFRRETETFSFNEMAIVVGLFFAGPVSLVTAQIVGAGCALVIHRRQKPMKLAFNLSQLALSTASSIAIFRLIARMNGTLSPREALGVFGGIALSTFIGLSCVVLVISLSTGEFQRGMLRRAAPFGVMVAASSASVGVLAAVLVRTNPWIASLLTVPAATLFVSYRAYVRQREQRESLEFLHESTKLPLGAENAEHTFRSFLDQARKMFHSDIAWLTFLGTQEGELARRTALGPEDHFEYMAPRSLDPRRGVWARVVSEGRAVVLPKPINNERLREFFEDEGIRDVMVAPVFGDSGVIGTMTVANRIGTASTFNEEDLRLFETFANHAGIALENTRLVSQLRESLARMTEMNRLKDDFVATVSHELRTPLTAVVGLTKTLLRPDTDYTNETAGRILEAIDRQGERLRCLIEDLLVVSRIESAPIRPRTEVVSVSRLLDDLSVEFRMRPGPVVLTMDVDDRIPELLTDESAVRRIVSNLIDNALKYSPEGAPVAVRARKEPGGVRISVLDRGQGIPADAQDRIFDRFYQADQTMTRRVGGAGLGLYICRNLAEGINGRVSLESSTAGEGSIFCLWLPLIPGAGHENSNGNHGGKHAV